MITEYIEQTCTFNIVCNNMVLFVYLVYLWWMIYKAVNFDLRLVKLSVS